MKKQKQSPCKRIAILPGDVAYITGSNIRTGQRMLKKIRELVGKKATDFITITEFCAFTGFLEQDVFNLLNNL